METTTQKHICKYCGALTVQPDSECYAKFDSWLDSKGNIFTRKEDNSFASETASYSLTEVDILKLKKINV